MEGKFVLLSQNFYELMKKAWITIVRWVYWFIEPSWRQLFVHNQAISGSSFRRSFAIPRDHFMTVGWHLMRLHEPADLCDSPHQGHPPNDLLEDTWCPAIKNEGWESSYSLCAHNLRASWSPWQLIKANAELEAPANRPKHETIRNSSIYHLNN